MILGQDSRMMPRQNKVTAQLWLVEIGFPRRVALQARNVPVQAVPRGNPFEASTGPCASHWHLTVRSGPFPDIPSIVPFNPCYTFP
jgi:hypothetical protein